MVVPSLFLPHPSPPLLSLNSFRNNDFHHPTPSQTYPSLRTSCPDRNPYRRPALRPVKPPNQTEPDVPVSTASETHEDPLSCFHSRSTHYRSTPSSTTEDVITIRVVLRSPVVSDGHGRVPLRRGELLLYLVLRVDHSSRRVLCGQNTSRGRWSVEQRGQTSGS